MRLRRIVFWLHLVTGCVAGLVVVIMSVTGVALTYERQLAEWADTRRYDVGPTPGRLSADALVARIHEQSVGETLGTLTLRSDPAAPASVVLGARTVFVDPYTGAVLGEGAPRVRAALRLLRDWHRWLGAGPEHRALPRAITGASNLAFLFLVASGFYLWWPKAWTWAQVRNVAWFRGGLTPRARDFNWHNTVGFWCAVPLFVVVLSGTIISYRWASDLVYRAAGEAPPEAGGREGRSGGAGAAPAWAPAGGLDRLIANAARQVPDWRTISLRVPSADDEAATLTIDRGTGGEPQKRATLVLDAQTGDVRSWEPFSTLSRGRRWRSWMRFAHTGEAAGLVGQTIAGLASAGGAVLVWTGFALAWRRFRARTRRRAAGEEVRSAAA